MPIDLAAPSDHLRTVDHDERATIDFIPGLVYTMAPTGEPEWYNRPLLEYFGKTPEEMNDWVAAGVVHPDDLARAIDGWRNGLQSGERYDVEFRLRRNDGEFRWFHLRSIPMRDGHGGITRWYGLVTDIHDQKRAERRLRRAIRARYEAALAERTRIARDMHDGLLQEITGIALQLRTVLPHVETSPQDSAQKLERILGSIQQANRAAREAVVGMRDEPESVDVVSAVQDEAQRLTAAAGLAFSLTVEGTVRSVSAAVHEAVVAIVHEALTNVVKHADANSVKVLVQFGSNRLRVSVIDNGHGLGAADNDEREARYGLVGMRERAANVGGVLRITSVPGEGTRIRFRVPVAR